MRRALANPPDHPMRATLERAYREAQARRFAVDGALQESECERLMRNDQVPPGDRIIPPHSKAA